LAGEHPVFAHVFMERRLQLANRLLRPDDAVLIVRIDEKEVHRLG